ncbi:hypothetical protein FRC02_007217 [Tulasnella sp. 418]|nr:hypothetical protein FRC02_007217 [Tulasnella sp. 418]
MSSSKVLPPRRKRVQVVVDGLDATTEESEAKVKIQKTSHGTKFSSAKSSSKTIHPFFQKSEGSNSEGSKNFRWLDAIGTTCKHGIHLQPVNRPKVAAFDLDHTLIVPKSGNRFAKDPSDWTWWTGGESRNGTVVKNRLKQLHEEGFSIVIITNQSAAHVSTAKRTEYTDKWKRKIPLIAANLPDVPFRIFAATAKDVYRKPMLGTWFALERIFAEDGVAIDLGSSFYVGDAAGRNKDHGQGDRLYAMNAAISFFTPEEFFLKRAALPFTITKYHPKLTAHDPDAPLFSPTSTPIVPKQRSSPEIVLFIGYPSTGKTSFYNKYFQPAGYAHVNQDTLKTKPKCLKMVRECIGNNQSCIVDNTNRDVSTRASYVELAKEFQVSIRAFYFNASIEVAWHNNLYRAFCLSDEARSKEGSRELVPWSAFSSFRDAFQPATLDEGYSEIKTVNWIFDGSDEEKRRYNMYLDIF